MRNALQNCDAAAASRLHPQGRSSGTVHGPTWHDPRSIPGVSVGRLTIALCFCALPAAASAQPWADAYRSGDYERAAALLHPIAVELALHPDAVDPAPAHQLSMMYGLGQGVTRDPVAACALAEVAFGITQNSPPSSLEDVAAREARIKKADAFLQQQCDRLSDADRKTANFCFAFGMPDEVVTVGPTAVRVSRTGIRVVDGGGELPLMNCPILIARVRPLTVGPPPDAAPGVHARHFLELLFWQAGGKDGSNALAFPLQWVLYEVRDKAIQLATLEDLDVVDSWPSPPVPKNFDGRLTIEMIRSGHVHWKFAAAPPKSGWIMLPAEKGQ